jgi:hypothetical protein
MNDDQKYALMLMYAALQDVVTYIEDPNMSVGELIDRSAQAVIVAEKQFPECLVKH